MEAFVLYVLDPFNFVFKQVVENVHGTLGEGSAFALPREYQMLLDFVACLIMAATITLPITTTLWIYRKQVNRAVRNAHIVPLLKYIFLFGYLKGCITKCLACPGRCSKGLTKVLCCCRKKTTDPRNDALKKFKVRTKGAEFYKQISINEFTIAKLKQAIQSKVASDNQKISKIIFEAEMMLIEEDDEVKDLKDGSVLSVTLQDKTSKELSREVLFGIMDQSITKVKARGNL